MSPTTALGLVLLGLALRDGPEAQELARQIREGDQEAFRAFFDRHHGRLFGYICSRGVPESDAADIVQNAFVYVWTHRSKIDPDRSLRSYLFRIGYTRTLNFFRDRDETPDVDLDLQPDSSTRSPEAETQVSLLRETVDAAIETLPERRRAAFRLCFLEGLSYREAAEALDVTRKTIENHVSHALRDLREALDGFEM
ncbi:RNA polymerase sigma-70 factor [Longibacter salinarum]|uniref:RNA polymerase sigma-70 factor n=1 Tax=Longibacter salinarum TaxID=1850348 RepID=A0A2A8CY06_9BACT|nr:sigma-70 family RNA polymerase sigma factor [Longibacter salinarum]PEN13510.1 RNA polymerase sigma-70 factor [Longibacter salinarum]